MSLPRAFYLILVYFLIVASFFATSIPLFEASDEAEHLIYMQTILDSGALPIIQSREAMAQQSDPILRWNNQSHHAPLYYLLGSYLISGTKRADLADYLRPNELIFLRDTTENNANKWLHPTAPPTSDTHIAVYILRFANVLLGAGTLALIYLIGVTISNDQRIGLLSAFFTASIPTFVVVHSSVTNDPLVIFFYSAGILWTARIWQNRHITGRDVILISAILAGIALSKLTGVSLFGLVYGALLLGVWQKRWTWQPAFLTGLIAGIATLLLAGWWYWRSFTLYGDPLAIQATQSIWGRETPLTLAMLPDELLRIWRSFWMMIGYLHQPVYGTDTFYSAVLALTGVSLVGLVQHFRRNWQSIYGWLLLACALVTGMLLYGTRSVDISYGRLLLPAIGAIAPLMIIGLTQFFGGWSILLILPVTAMSLYAPFVTIPNAYPQMTRVPALPNDIVAINQNAEGLTILGVRLPEGNVQGGETVTVDLYFTGRHPDNPALLVTAVDSQQVKRFAHLEIFPAMAATDTLADGIYHLPIRLTLSESDVILAPRIMNILFSWVNLEDNRRIPFADGRELLEFNGAIYVDERYQATQLSEPANLNFGDTIQLHSYQLSETTLQSETLTVSFEWSAIQPPLLDWMLTVQLVDDADNIITQVDEMPYWYPTWAWVVGARFNDQRQLTIPEDLPSGTYHIRIGWYRADGDNFVNLPVNSQSTSTLPTTLEIP